MSKFMGSNTDPGTRIGERAITTPLQVPIEDSGDTFSYKKEIFNSIFQRISNKRMNPLIKKYIL